MLLTKPETFAELPAVEQRFHLINAVLICCRDWRSSFNPHKLLWLYARLIRKADYAKELVKFREYYAAGTLCPPAPTSENYAIANGEEIGKGRELGGPALAKVYQYVAGLPGREIQAYGRTAWDYPLGLAYFLYFTQLESHGFYIIENSKERQAGLEMAMTNEQFREYERSK